jgi:hypothetical protein
MTASAVPMLTPALSALAGSAVTQIPDRLPIPGQCLAGMTFNWLFFQPLTGAVENGNGEQHAFWIGRC